MNSKLFTSFEESTAEITPPENFTFPFNYEVHPLAKLAAEQLQKHLQEQHEWHHDFGLIEHSEHSLGKMFGVLVVKKSNNEIGFLSAFSGRLAGKNKLPYFVPPIFDLQEKDGFFNKGEAELNIINQEIKDLESDADYCQLKGRCTSDEARAQQELNDFRRMMKQAKTLRNEKRSAALEVLSASDMEVLREDLKNESLKYQYDYKILVKEWKTSLEKNSIELKVFEDKINKLKDWRKAKSNYLQRQLFDQYQFLNIDGETVSVADIFQNTPNKIPPGGAGECAAPKLLQYAFQNDMKPICMAEFWWGESPRSEIRKHGNFYPSCRGKCEPILGHMLKGMTIDANPALLNPKPKGALEIIYEDDDLVAINKPAEFLSVPGKLESDSIYTRIQTMYPEAKGPIIVHRLDMSTSGIMVLTKNKESHENLQKQFLNRQVVKRYVALLDGTIEGDEGLIKLPLRVDLDNRPQQLVCYEYGKPAVTRWQKVEIKDGRTRVFFFPLTGRTHQLRVHAAHPDGLNTSIIGDDLYGKRNTHLHLHAESIKFRHPKTNKTIKIQVDPDF